MTFIYIIVINTKYIFEMEPLTFNLLWGLTSLGIRFLVNPQIDQLLSKRIKLHRFDSYRWIGITFVRVTAEIVQWRIVVSPWFMQFLRRSKRRNVANMHRNVTSARSILDITI